jgi:hypothetical protein
VVAIGSRPKPHMIALTKEFRALCVAGEAGFVLTPVWATVTPARPRRRSLGRCVLPKVSVLRRVRGTREGCVPSRGGVLRASRTADRRWHVSWARRSVVRPVVRAISRWRVRQPKRAAGVRSVRALGHGSGESWEGEISEAGKRGVDAHGAPQSADGDELGQGPVEEVLGLYSEGEASVCPERHPSEPRLPSPPSRGFGLREVVCSLVPSEVRGSVLSESEESACVVEVVEGANVSGMSVGAEREELACDEGMLTDGGDRCGIGEEEEAGPGEPRGSAAFGGVAVEVQARSRRHQAGTHVRGHVRFLQHLFRGYQRMRPGAWGRRGGLLGCPSPRRPVTTFRCRGGMCLAEPAEYEAMKARAREVMDWQNIYVDIFRRLKKAAPRSYHPFAAAGGDAAGVRAAGGVPYGADVEWQEHFVSMFGEGAFQIGDATDQADFLAKAGRVGPVVIIASPPCKKHSTIDVRNMSNAEELIAVTRDHCDQSGQLYIIENVKGAASEMKEHAILLYGAFFGLQVDRPRFQEANFPLHVDEYLRGPGLALRSRGCLGSRRKLKRLDPFGRPELVDCCRGTLYPVQGKTPVGFTAEEGAMAMGLEVGHMPFERMAQAVPPAYGEWGFGQACMEWCARRFGVPRISFDEMRRDPAAARRQLAFWLRGAGAEEADAGMQLLGRGDEVGGGNLQVAGGVAVEAGEIHVAVGDDEQVEEVEFREVYYGRRGDFQQQWAPGGRRWLDALVGESELPGEDRVGWLEGQSTHLCLTWRQWREWQLIVSEALKVEGTRVVLQLRRLSDGEAASLRALGFERIRASRKGAPEYATATDPARLRTPSEWWAAGERRSAVPSFRLDLDEAEARMDPRDNGQMKDDSEAKMMRSYLPVDWDPERWRDTGLPVWIETFMRSGVMIEPEIEPPMADHPFYEWASDEHLLKAILEADRHLTIGALEYVPLDKVRDVVQNCIVHPWVVVKQGEKWRLCHDYSIGTNKYMKVAAFGLPSPWDVRASVRPDSYFAKYDIRDGFFHVPVHGDSKRRLVVRHPGTGRLMWANRLPFGYVASPYLFCALTEAIANKLRKAAAGMGIHFYVFVDDFLVVGDDEELTMKGCEMLEEELKARGISWAPHKHRGPAKCMEFLGLLLSNIHGHQGISLTRKRRDGLLTLIDSWEVWRRESSRPGRKAIAEPRELASLLGKLVFASQAVWNGRPYMQSMLSTFAGHTVDWVRGTVTLSGGERRRGIELKDGFWADLSWWRRHLRERYSVPWASDELAVAAITGTDASGWGTGQLAWIDGQRLESVLPFTHAEQRRPINWRELLGIVRVLEQYGGLLAGRTVLIETDNMAAKGASAKRSSRAEDMQELIRRLVSSCERHKIKLRMTHTPGAKLDRPDQTSRGDPMEEARYRLSREVFNRIEKAYGPFTSFLGPERHHVTDAYVAGGGDEAAAGAEVLWMHPAYATVGSALRLMQERAALSVQRGGAFRALALIPDDGRAGWNSLLKQTTLVARLEAGSEALERYRVGAWRKTTALRDAKLVMYPRAAGGGGLAMPARIEKKSRWHGVVATVSGSGVARPLGYWDAGDDFFCRDLMPGTFVYMPEKGPCRGRLFMVSDHTRVSDGEDAEVTLYPMLKNPNTRTEVDDSYDLDKSVDKVCYEMSNVWVVSHMVHEVEPKDLLRRRSSENDEERSVRAEALSFRRFKFDWKVAQREISRVSADMGDSWVVLDNESGGFKPGEYSSYMSPTPSDDSCEMRGIEEVVERKLDAMQDKMTEKAGTSSMEGSKMSQSTAGTCSGCDEEDVQRSAHRGVRHSAMDDLAKTLGGFGLNDSGMGLDLDKEVGTLRSERIGEVPYLQSETLADARAKGTSRAEASWAGSAQGPATAPPFSPSGGKAKMYAGVACGGCGKPVVTAGVNVLGSVVHARQACKREMARKVEKAELLSRAKSVGAVALSQQDPFSRSDGLFSPGGAGDQLRPDRPIGQDRSKVAANQVPLSESIVGGGQWRRVQAEEMLSAPRVAAITACLDGRCDASKCRYAKTACTHCTRGLHVVECAQLGSARAAVGRLKCFYCRAEEMAPHREPTPSRLRSAMEVMLTQLELGSEATAASTADYNKLEQDFVIEKGLEGDELLLPRHNKETFLAWMTWGYHDAGRAKSMKAMWRHLPTIFKSWDLQDLTTDSDVKRHQKKLETQLSRDPDPMATATERMMTCLVNDVIPAERSSLLLARRDQIGAIAEGYGGVRIGEITDAGQGHGALCENVSWVEDMISGEGFLDLFIPTEKTGFSRYTGVVRHPDPGGKVDVKRVLFEYWHAMGCELESTRIGGMAVTRANKYVLRVSLQGMKEEGIGFLIEALESSSSDSARANLKSTHDYARMRIKATGATSGVKRFVNVAVGTKESMALRALKEHLKLRGFGADRVHIISAPFICATTGGSKPRQTLMPLSSTTMTGGVTKGFLIAAARAANMDRFDLDPDLNMAVKDIETGKWGTHSLRRLCDKRVKKTCKELGLPMSTVDAMLGWKESERRHDMQDHYDEQNLRERLERARISSRAIAVARG